MTEIKVGDKVRIKDNYPMKDETYYVGMEFKVEKVKEREHWSGHGQGAYVTGDPHGRGVWVEYLERVVPPTLSGIGDLIHNRWEDTTTLDGFEGKQGQIDYWRDHYQHHPEDLAVFNAYVAVNGLEPVVEPKAEPKVGDKVRVTIEGTVNFTSGKSDYFEVKADGALTGLYRSDVTSVEVLEPAKPPLPTENGVYVPTGNSLTAGPNVFVLYNGAWDVTPKYGSSENVLERVTFAHENGGLTRLIEAE